MQRVVGVSDMVVSDSAEDLVVTHSLGSCVGVSVWDPAALVGGILHFQLPSATDGVTPASVNPCVYADTGIPALFQAALELGASLRRLEVKLIGGASVLGTSGLFNIGLRNLTAARRILWRHGLLIAAEDVGGDSWRTMALDVSSGKLTIKTSCGVYQL